MAQNSTDDNAGCFLIVVLLAIALLVFPPQSVWESEALYGKTGHSPIWSADTSKIEWVRMGFYYVILIVVGTFLLLGDSTE